MGFNLVHLVCTTTLASLLFAASVFVPNAAAAHELVGRKLLATTLQSCLATGGARTAFPGTSDYTNARSQYNLRNQYAPAAFVFPTTVAQVQNAVSCSKQVGVGISPRGGGHSYEDYSLGGRDGVLVVDMTGFTQLTYNKAAQTAVVGAGWRLGPLYYALWNAGKVTLPAGSCPTVGVAGHALGGGWGFGSRKFGVVSDSILEVQIVSANGTLIIANKNQNSGLLFSMKGAGANSYGIVTQFTFQVHDVSAPVTHFKYSWTNKNVQVQNFKAFQTWGVNAPAEIGADFYLDPSGQSWLEGTYFGTQANLTPLLATFVSNSASGATVSIQQMTWIQVILVNTGLSASADPSVLNNQPLPTQTFKAKSIYVKPPGLSDAGVTAMVNSMRSDANNNAYFIYDLYGAQSAINKVAAGATAFVHRNSLYSIQMVAYWGSNANEATQDTTFIDNYWTTVNKYATTSEAYQNYIDRDMPLSAYYSSNLNTLKSWKKQYDPQNVFNFPQSIPLP